MSVNSITVLFEVLSPSLAFINAHCAHSLHQLLANAAIASARRRVAVRGRAVLVVPEAERPHPGRADRRGVHLEDAADHSAVSEHVEIIVGPLAGRARGGSALEQ